MNWGVDRFIFLQDRCHLDLKRYFLSPAQIKKIFWPSGIKVGKKKLESWAHITVRSQDYDYSLPVVTAVPPLCEEESVHILTDFRTKAASDTTAYSKLLQGLVFNIGLAMIIRK